MNIQYNDNVINMDNDNDKFGITTVYQNKLWWSYDPIYILPPKTPLYNKNYESIYMEFDINSYITRCFINYMNVNNYYYIQPSNVNNYRFNFNNAVISFDYNMLTNLNKNKKISEIFLYYKYPSTVCVKSSSSFRENDNIFLNINLLPLTTNITKWYITVNFNNLEKSSIRKDIIQKSIYNMLMKIFELLQIQSNNILLKQYMTIYQKKIINDNINQDFKYLLKRYKYPDIQLVLNLYNYHKNKKLIIK
jgi:hypothetical protein